MSVISRAMAMVAFCYIGAAQATPIDNTVNVFGRYWAQVDQFANLAWYEIDIVCPGGPCGEGTLNGNSMAGWTWASVDDVNNLFNTYVGEGTLSGPDYYEEVGSDWAPAFIKDFNPIMTYESHEVVHGWTADFHPTFYWSGRLAQITDSFDPNRRDYAISENHHINGFSSSNTGAWFFIDIPEPSIVSLMSLSIALLFLNRSKKRKL